MGMPDWELEEENWGACGPEEEEAAGSVAPGLLAASGAAAASDGVEMMGTSSTGVLFLVFFLRIAFVLRPRKHVDHGALCELVLPEVEERPGKGEKEKERGKEEPKTSIGRL